MPSHQMCNAQSSSPLVSQGSCLEEILEDTFHQACLHPSFFPKLCTQGRKAKHQAPSSSQASSHTQSSSPLVGHESLHLGMEEDSKGDTSLQACPTSSFLPN